MLNNSTHFGTFRHKAAQIGYSSSFDSIRSDIVFNTIQSDPVALNSTECNSSAHSLRLHHQLGRLTHNLIRSPLHDPARLGQLRADAHEVGVDVAGGLAAFVDAPVDGLIVSDMFIYSYVRSGRMEGWRDRGIDGFSGQEKIGVE